MHHGVSGSYKYGQWCVTVLALVSMESALDLSVAKRRRIENEAYSKPDLTPNEESECNGCLSTAGTRIPAEAVCFTCEQYYCQRCISQHNTAFNPDHFVMVKKDRNNADQISKLIHTLDSVHLLDDIMQTKVKPLPNINAKHVRDSNNSSISGCTVLSNDNLAVVDCDNSCIKVINIHDSIILQYFKLDTKPWDICELDSDHVIVTCPEMKSLLVFNIKEELNISERILVNVNCHGICCVEDRLYVSSTAPAAVQIFDKSGNVLQHFEKNEAGSALFEWPLYLAVSPKIDIILVSDYFNDKVVVIQLAKFNKDALHYKHDRLKYPRGIAYDDAGSVFLAGRYNIHQMTMYCRHVQVALDTKDGVEFAQCVSFSKTSNLLFVGKYRSNTMSNWISVFHIE